MQSTAPHRQLCAPLTGHALAGLGTTPLAGPIRAKTPFITYLEPNFCHRETLAFMRFYNTIFGVVLRDGRGLIHGPRQESHHPMPIELKHTTGGTWVRALWFRALVLGSRSTGRGKIVQEPQAGFHVARWGGCFVIRRRCKVALPASS